MCVCVCCFSCFQTQDNLFHYLDVCLIFCLFLFWNFVVVCFLLSIKQFLSKKWNSPNPQNEKCTKTTLRQKQLIQVQNYCFVGGCPLKLFVFWKQNEISGFSPLPKTKNPPKCKKCVKNWSKVVLKIGPSVLRNISGSIITQLCGHSLSLSSPLSAGLMRFWQKN